MIEKFVLTYILKKTIKIVFVGALIVPIMWGMTTWNIQKGLDLYMWEMNIISKPVVYLMELRTERVR